VDHEITYHTFIHENVRKRFMEGFHHDAHPMGMLVSAVAALSTFYPDAKDIFDPRHPLQADRPPHRQDADAGRRRLPLQRRHALRLPRQQPRLLPPTSCR
jgi:citrate synthase